MILKSLILNENEANLDNALVNRVVTRYVDSCINHSVCHAGLKFQVLT